MMQTDVKSFCLVINKRKDNKNSNLLKLLFLYLEYEKLLKTKIEYFHNKNYYFSFTLFNLFNTSQILILLIRKSILLIVDIF